MSRTIGYVRVSKWEQDSAAQETKVRSAGADPVFVDRSESSRVVDRPQWLACLEHLRAGDTLVVERLDRLGVSERLVIETLNDLGRRGVDIKSLNEPLIDTTKPRGRELFGIVSVFAQLRSLAIRESTMRGLQSARSSGRVGGRPSVMSPGRIAEARRMRAAGRSIADIAAVLGVGASSVSRALAKVDQDVEANASRERRVFYRDTKPYETPAALDDLRGPAGGELELPHDVYWGPERTVDLGTLSGIRKAYQAVLREGTVDDQAKILNRNVLVEVWAELSLPDRVRVAWEARFPELTVAVPA